MSNRSLKFAHLERLEGAGLQLVHDGMLVAQPRPMALHRFSSSFAEDRTAIVAPAQRRNGRPPTRSDFAARAVMPEVLVMEEPSQLEQFRGARHLASLVIRGRALSGLGALEAAERIESLSVEGPAEVRAVVFPNLRSLGRGRIVAAPEECTLAFPQLREVDTELHVSGQFETLVLPRLAHVGGDLRVRAAGATTLWLPSLREVDGWLRLEWLPRTRAILLPRATRLGGLVIDGCPVLEEVAADDLTEVGAPSRYDGQEVRLQITRNPALSAVNLRSLAIARGPIVITKNPLLPSMWSLHTLRQHIVATSSRSQ